MNKLFRLVTIALILIVLYAFWTAVDVFAAPDHITNYELTGMMTGGECQAKGSQGDTFLSINDEVCQTSLAWGMNSYSSIPESMVETVTVDTESTRKAHKQDESTDATINTVESPIVSTDENNDTPAPVADENPPAESEDSNDGKGDNGHGDNVDGVDSSNPGNGPKNQDGADESAPIDDEKEKGKS